MAALEALDKLGRGVFLLDTAGTVIFTNRAAGVMVARNEGLQIRGHHLQLECDGAQQRFDEFLATSVGTQCQSLVMGADEGPGGCPYRMLVSPLTNGAGFCVFVYEPSGGHQPLPLDVLKGLYSLTSSEAQLANALFKGHTLTQAARSRGISINTAKYTLKSIFKKCKVRSRAELMLLLSLGPRTL